MSNFSGDLAVSGFGPQEVRIKNVQASKSNLIEQFFLNLNSIAAIPLAFYKNLTCIPLHLLNFTAFNFQPEI